MYVSAQFTDFLEKLYELLGEAWQACLRQKTQNAKRIFGYIFDYYKSY